MFSSLAHSYAEQFFAAAAQHSRCCLPGTYFKLLFCFPRKLKPRERGRERGGKGGELKCKISKLTTAKGRPAWSVALLGKGRERGPESQKQYKKKSWSRWSSSSSSRPRRIDDGVQKGCRNSSSSITRALNPFSAHHHHHFLFACSDVSNAVRGLQGKASKAERERERERTGKK